MTSFVNFVNIVNWVCFPATHTYEEWRITDAKKKERLSVCSGVSEFSLDVLNADLMAFVEWYKSMPDSNVIQMHILIHYNRNVIPVSLSSFREILKFSSFLIPELQRSICFIYFSMRGIFLPFLWPWWLSNMPRNKYFRCVRNESVLNW